MATPKHAYVPTDEDVRSFHWELDRWGKPNPRGSRSRWTDPFLFAVCNCAAAGRQGARFHVVRPIYAAFETLGDLLAATADEIAAIRGVGPKAIALLLAELDRRGLELAEVAS
jgi:hypothetical protein